MTKLDIDVLDDQPGCTAHGEHRWLTPSGRAQ